MNQFHNSPDDMARNLAQYITDPHKVRSEVLATFISAPCVAVIAGYRASYFRQKSFAKEQASRPFTRAQGDRDEQYAKRMKAASDALATSINQARGIMP